MSTLPELTLHPIPNKPIVPEESERYEQLDPKPVARRDLPKDIQAGNRFVRPDRSRTQISADHSVQRETLDTGRG